MTSADAADGTGQPADPSRDLLHATDDDRLRWVAEHRPAEPAEVENWWLHLFLVITHHVRGEPAERVGWVRVHDWAVRHAVDTGALTAPDAAKRTSTFVLAVRRLGITDELAATLPTADAVVEDCLRHVPFTAQDVPARPDITGRRPTEDELELLRRGRLAKNLVRSAEPHRDHVRDVELAARLDAWIAVLPRLA